MERYAEKIEKHNKTNDVERDVEEEFNLLKENIVYAQSLARIGSWTYDIKRRDILDRRNI